MDGVTEIIKKACVQLAKRERERNLHNNHDTKFSFSFSRVSLYWAHNACVFFGITTRYFVIYCDDNDAHTTTHICRGLINYALLEACFLGLENHTGQTAFSVGAYSWYLITLATLKIVKKFFSLLKRLYIFEFINSLNNKKNMPPRWLWCSEHKKYLGCVFLNK